MNSLNNLMDNDCTIGWPINQNIGTQIVIAKPKSRFLKLWLQSYQDYSNYLIENFKYICNNFRG